MVLEPNRPPFGVAFETSLLEDVAFEPNRPGDGVLDVSLLGDMPFQPEKMPTVDEDLVDPNELLLEGAGWMRCCRKVPSLNQMHCSPGTPFSFETPALMTRMSNYYFSGCYWWQRS